MSLESSREAPSFRSIDWIPPLRHVNNMIEDWSRRADVIWKNEGLSLTMAASDAFRSGT
jgi:hypothetical protein